MKQTSVFLIVILIFLVAKQGNAQIEDLLKQLQTEQSGNQGEDAAQSQAMLNMFGMGGADITTEDSYKFTGSIKMEMENFDPKNISSGKTYYETKISDNDNVYAMKFTGDNKDGSDSEGFMIFDYANGAMIILSEENGEKTGMVTPIDTASMNDLQMTESERKEYDEAVKHLGYNKSGKTKTILGHKCYEYKYSDEDGSVVYWFTDDVLIKQRGLYGSVGGLASVYSGSMPYGTLMEMEAVDKETKERSHMKIVEIKKNISEKVNLTDYELVKMGGMPMGN